MKRRTKVVCTIGPATASKVRLAELIHAGMNVARINCSHGDWDMRHQWIEWIRELSNEIAPVGILVDLQGPKFRLGVVQGGAIQVTEGQTVVIGSDPTCQLPIPRPEICDAMQSGDRVLLGDGDVELKLGRESDGTFEAKVLTSGTIKTKQGVTLVGKVFEVKPITDQDELDVFEAAKAGADFVALSYVQRANDLRDLKRLLTKFGSDAWICAKIETRQAVRELDEIIKVTDSIMVARGDMGLQMDIQEVPLTQKHIIKKCNAAGIPVITATQMLESMMVNARPTRAEATDVANAILDGTDAIMLSGETAAGAHPIEAVKTMCRIAETAETAFNYDFYFRHAIANRDNTSAVAEAAVQLSITLKSKAILTTTTSGMTSRMVSKFRPRAPILCTAWNTETLRKMSMIWGVEAMQMNPPTNTDEVIHDAINGFLRKKRIRVGDLVVVTAGVPVGKVGNTNLIQVETVK